MKPECLSGESARELYALPRKGVLLTEKADKVTLRWLHGGLRRFQAGETKTDIKNLNIHAMLHVHASVVPSPDASLFLCYGSWCRPLYARMYDAYITQAQSTICHIKGDRTLTNDIVTFLHSLCSTAFDVLVRKCRSNATHKIHLFSPIMLTG